MEQVPALQIGKLKRILFINFFREKCERKSVNVSLEFPFIDNFKQLLQRNAIISIVERHCLFCRHPHQRQLKLFGCSCGS